MPENIDPSEESPVPAGLQELALHRQAAKMTAKPVVIGEFRKGGFTVRMTATPGKPITIDLVCINPDQSIAWQLEGAYHAEDDQTRQ